MTDPSQQTKQLKIGRTELVLPADHALDRYQAQWPRYDLALGEIARVVWSKYPGYKAIDIGANVGDTAALLCTHQDVRTLCVEGHPGFVALLEENARRIGPHIEIERAFVGAADSTAVMAIQDNDRGTAKLVEGAGSQAIATKTLATILAEHPDFLDHRLLKIDTDGFDFPIINSSGELLKSVKPVLFYEYAPFEGSSGIGDGVRTLQTLAEAGYAKIMIYDNFGHYLINLDVHDIERFIDLNSFLCSNRVDGSAIYYLDICAFAPADLDLFTVLRRYELGRFFQF